MAKEKKVRRRKQPKRYREALLLRVNIALALAIIVVCFGIAVRDIREKKAVLPGDLVVPDWIEQDFFVINKHSRPRTPMTKVNDLVIH